GFIERKLGRKEEINKFKTASYIRIILLIGISSIYHSEQSDKSDFQTPHGSQADSLGSCDSVISSTIEIES
ncbi:MAG: hypothetical protein RR432_05090, partial [Alistipes sp.]